MAALCANGTCDADEAARVATAVRRVRQSPGLPVALRHAAMAAALQMAAAQRGAEGALQLALAGVAAAPGLALPGQAAAPPLLQLPSAGTPAFLLEEAVQLVAAASAAAAPSAEAAAAFEPASDEASGGAQPLPLPLPLLEQLAALLSAGQDCRLRHLTFVLLQLLAAQPPTVYRPPPTEEAEDAALLAASGPAVAGQAVSMGMTHRTGQQQASGAAAAAAAAAAPKIRLQLGGGGGGGAGGARSMAISGELGCRGRPSWMDEHVLEGGDLCAVAARPRLGDKPHAQQIACLAVVHAAYAAFTLSTRTLPPHPGASGPALSGEGPALSDARARADGAVEQPVPPAAQGQVFSPARQPGGEADDASSRWPQHQGVPPGQQSQQAAAPAAAPKFKLKIAGGPGQPEAAAAAPAAPAAAAGAPQQLSLLELAQQVQQAQREGTQQPAWNAGASCGGWGSVGVIWTRCSSNLASFCARWLCGTGPMCCLCHDWALPLSACKRIAAGSLQRQLPPRPVQAGGRAGGRKPKDCRPKAAGSLPKPQARTFCCSCCGLLLPACNQPACRGGMLTKPTSTSPTH